MNKRLLLPAAATLLCLWAPGGARAQGAVVPGTNIALHQSVTFSVAPNYSLSADPDDIKQLTNGVYTDTTQQMWVQKEAVCWSWSDSPSSVVITIDLGSVQPISGASFSTAAGTGGVGWPTAILMATSDDDHTWHAAGNLVQMARKNGAVPTAGYWDGTHNFRYVTHDLKTTGRYIAFGVVDVGFLAADEIEVYKGDDSWNQPAAGVVFTDMKDYVAHATVTASAQDRLSDDSAAVRQAVLASALPADRKSALLHRLDSDNAAIDQLPEMPIDTKTILPLDDTHRDIFAVNGVLLSEQGLPRLTVWKQPRYAFLPIAAAPAGRGAARLKFSMLGNQFRSDDLLLTNASDRPQSIDLHLANTPDGAKDGWLRVYSVAWTDTSECVPIADALLPVTEQTGVYSVDVPAGMTRKVWFTVDSSKVPAGHYNSNLRLHGVGYTQSVPFDLTVAKVAMGKPRVSLGMWDYTNGGGYVGVTDRNSKAAIAMMQSHFVDCPWATSAALPHPTAADFDADGNLNTKLDFSNLDEWIARWPGARRYLVANNSSDSFAGAKMGTAQFDARVGSWAKAIVAHVAELGLQPGQLGVLLVDEPGTQWKIDMVAAWGKPIRAAAPTLTIFEDPAVPKPDQPTFANTVEHYADIVCDNFAADYMVNGKRAQDYYEKMRQSGREMWFYQCGGPVHLMDPQLYYRYSFWHSYKAGATGEGFWAFSDNRQRPGYTSWNTYTNRFFSYSPAFLDTDTVYDSVHWDAVREGVEDYEELAMLRDAIAASKDAAWKARAQTVLDGAVEAVTGIWQVTYDWKNKFDPNLADAQLQKVQDTLVRHNG